MQIDLETLGLDKATLTTLVVNNLTERLLDDDFEPIKGSQFENSVMDAFRKTIDARLKEIIETQAVPKLEAYLLDFKIKETNTYGEPKREPETISEYIDRRCSEFLTETVNVNGKTKKEEGYSWSASTTRICYMVHQHLKYEIENRIGNALKDINSQISTGLAEATKMAINNVLQKLKVEVKV